MYRGTARECREVKVNEIEAALVKLGVLLS
jgi:hypothetical protein